MLRCLLMTFLLLGFFTAPAIAHKVNIFAYAEGGTVYCESYFPDGRPVIKGRVEVLDSQKALLLQGETDAAGLFQFPVPKQDDLTLSIDAGMGHRNQYLLPKGALDE